VFLAILAVVVVTLSLLEYAEMVPYQVALTAARFVLLVLLIATVWQAAALHVLQCIVCAITHVSLRSVHS